MQLRLEVSEGPHQGRRITLRSPVSVTFGRSDRSDFVFADDPQISSVHFRISCDNSVCELEDLRSTNGTTINQQRVAVSPLSDGDRIRAGLTVFDVQLADNVSEPREELRPKESRDTVRGTATETFVDLPVPPPSSDAPSTSQPEPVRHAQPPATPAARVTEPGPAAEDHAAARPTVVLRIKTASGLERTVWIRSGQHLTFGRDEQADIALDGDPLLSSLHFAIKFDGQRCELRDLDSQNGVSVNGISVRTTQLHHGDSILVGGSCMNVSMSGSPPSDPAPPDRQSANRQEFATSVPRQKWPPYASAVLDPDPSVRRRVLVSAAWRREPWLPEHGLQSILAMPPDWQAGYVGCVIAAPDLAARIVTALSTLDDPRRFNLLGALGSPHAMPIVLGGIENTDPRVASAAGNAFRRITGVDITGPERTTLAPRPSPYGEGTSQDGPDGSDPDWPVFDAELEAEFAEEVALPDVALARRFWQEQAERFARGTRWSGGIDVGRQFDAADLLDLQSRAEMLLREHFHGRLTVVPGERLTIRIGTDDA